MTPIPTLFFIVIVQVLVFQFLAVRLTRTLPDRILGAEKLQSEIGQHLNDYRRRAGRSRYLIGALLLAIAFAATLVVPLGYGPTKLTLSAISVTSSFVLAIGITLDRRRFARFVDELPDPPLRVASLRRRKVHDYYPVRWETIPVLIFLATIAVTIWMLGRGPFSAGAAITGMTDARAWIGPIVQIGLWVLLSALASASVTMPGCGAFQGRAYHDHPEEVVFQDERQRRRGIRFLFLAKAGVMLQLAFIQMHRLPMGLGGSPEPWVSIGRWVVLVLLLLLFSLYLRMVAGEKRVAATGSNHER